MFKEEFNENSFIKEFDYQHSSEILPLYCIPIPGEVEWVKNINSGSESVSFSNEFPSKQKSKKKRSYNESSYESNEETVDIIMPSHDSKKKIPIEFNYNSNKEHNTLRDSNFPITGMKGSPCIIKIYGDYESCMFKVNDIYNFIGVYYLKKSDNIDYNNINDDQIEEISSIDTPIIHCLYMEKLGEGHPMVPLNKEVFNSEFISFKQSIPHIRNKLTKLLEFCLGDSLAAEYAIFNMISRVHSRLSDHTPLGTLPLNISNINDPNYILNVKTLISNLVPKLHFIELNLNNMNKNNYVPYKNYTQGRLISGELQLSAGTQLIIDETTLEQCEFTGNAYKNIMGIKSLIDTQLVPYDFEFHTIEFFTDIPVLILSNGRSIFNNSCQIPLISHYSLTFHEALQKVEGTSTNILHDFRKYLGYIRSLEFKEGNESITDYLSNEFIMLRQDNPNLTSELFGHWLNLSKLVALSFGEVELGNDIWERTKNLEKERLSRLGAL